MKTREARSQKPEARSQKPEARSQKPEARSQKPEARSQKLQAKRVADGHQKVSKPGADRSKMEKLSRLEFQSNEDRSVDLLKQLGLSAQAEREYRRFLNRISDHEKLSHPTAVGEEIKRAYLSSSDLPKTDQLYNALTRLLKAKVSPKIIQAYLRRVNSGYEHSNGYSPEGNYYISEFARVLLKVAGDPELAKALLKYIGYRKSENTDPHSVSRLDSLFKKDLSPNVLASMKSLLLELGLTKAPLKREHLQEAGFDVMTRPVNKVFGLTAYYVGKLLEKGKGEAAVLEFITNARTAADRPLEAQRQLLEGFTEIAKLDDAPKRSALATSFRSVLGDVKPENLPDGESFAQALIQLDKHRAFFGKAYDELVKAAKGLKSPRELIEVALLLKKSSGDCDTEAVSALAEKASSIVFAALPLARYEAQTNLTCVAEGCQAIRGAGATPKILDLYLDCVPKIQPSYTSTSWASSLGRRVWTTAEDQSSFQGMNNPAWLAEAFIHVLNQNRPKLAEDELERAQSNRLSEYQLTIFKNKLSIMMQLHPSESPHPLLQ